tara:strand:- start:2022 stop:2282 length:261 start_codon:yes stop_codon:yes gene_type:complete
MLDDLKTWPVAIVEDRYGGVYAGGAWIAVANFDNACGDGMFTRLGHVMDNAHADDVTAMHWQKPTWVGVGDTPDEALADLQEKQKQ